MLTAIDNAGNQAIAWQTEKGQAPFSCPECGGAVVLKKGNMVVHHFAHMPPFDCEYGQGETRAHLEAKREIYEYLANHPHVRKCALERYLGKVRPDISCYIRNVPVAIEVQHSNIDCETIRERFYHYAEKRIALLWVVTKDLLSNNAYYEKRVQLPEWKQFLSSIYRGKLYVHKGGGRLRVVEYRKYSMYQRLGDAHHVTYCNIADVHFNSVGFWMSESEHSEFDLDAMIWEHSETGYWANVNRGIKYYYD